MPPLPDYFELDGDWAKRQPVVLGDTTLYAFVVPADRGALEALCQAWINARPTGGAIRVEPLLPAVVLAFADVQRLASGDDEQKRLGFLHEQDVAFFLPVRLHAGGERRIAALLPYLFVDSGAGLIAGREIYGFPKELASFTFTPDPLHLTARSLVIPTYGQNSPASEQVVVELTAEAQDIGKLPLPVGVGATLVIVERTLAELGVIALDVLGAAASGFDLIRLIFLKQFRDAAQSRAACHQSIVEARGALRNPGGGHVLTGRYHLSLPHYDSVRIAETLGIAQPLDLRLGFSLHLDLVVSPGDVLWTAT